jgi:integrase
MIARMTECIEELKARRDNIAAIPTLSVSDLLDAAAALELLGDLNGVTLVQAVRSFVQGERARGASVTVAELFSQFRKAKQTKSAPYRNDIRWANDRMQAFLDIKASDITRVHISDAVAGMPDSSRNAVLRALRALFRFGHDLGYLTELPVRRSDFAEIKRKELEILPVGKIRSLLETALIHDLELLPMLLAEAFGGVRPAEAARLQWSDLDFLKGRLTVRAAISKTGTARPIKLEPCALDWFRRYRASGGPRTGALMTLAEPALRRRLRKLRYLAGFRGAGAHWTPGALRDAFCSYHLCHFGSIDRLIEEAGHTSLRTTKDHYLGLVSAEAAAEFWDMLPPGEKGKIIQLVG